MKNIIDYSRKALFVATLLSLYSCSTDPCKELDKEWSKKINSEKNSCVSSLPLDVFIENSGSIDGYVNSMGPFKTDTYAMISSSVVSNANLNYINQIKIPQQNDKRNFILNLSVADFIKNGGNRSSSDIAKVIEMATENCAKRSSLIVSDFILSPNDTNVIGYLALEKSDIKNIIERHLKANSDIAVVVMQGLSGFNGTYYNVNDQPSKINETRPFYVMLVGLKQHLALLMNKTKKSTHFVHTYSEFVPTVVNYEIQKNTGSKVGNFRICKNGKHHISKIEPSSRSTVFEFKVMVDYSKIPLDDVYIMSKDNYEISDPNFIIKDIAPNPDKKSNFSHIVTVANANKKRLSPSDLEIRLKRKFPKWIKNSNDDKGITAVNGKTFGILPLLEGVQLAYSEKNTDDYYLKMNFILEK